MTVKGDAPPAHVMLALTVNDCPVSIAGGESTSFGVGAGVTVTAADTHCCDSEAGEPLLLSVTSAEKLVVVVSALVVNFEDVCPEMEVEQELPVAEVVVRRAPSARPCERRRGGG